MSLFSVLQLAQFLRVGLVQNLRAVPLLGLNTVTIFVFPFLLFLPPCRALWALGACIKVHYEYVGKRGVLYLYY
jgi:hypothetical protein